jgi:hypothetical protein
MEADVRRALFDLLHHPGRARGQIAPDRHRHLEHDRAQPIVRVCGGGCLCHAVHSGVHDHTDLQGSILGQGRAELRDAARRAQEGADEIAQGAGAQREVRGHRCLHRGIAGWEQRGVVDQVPEQRRRRAIRTDAHRV